MSNDKGAITVGTADWLKATRDMQISAYVETSTLITANSQNTFSRQEFEAVLRKVSRRRPSEPGEASSGT
jgi:hypothetical protein